jgi:murein L,D-transpeptidase YcbB/YkuD
VRGLVGLLFVWSVLGAEPSAQVLDEELRRQVELLREYGSITVEGERIAFSPELAAFYERRGFRPVWIDPRKAEDLLRCVRGAPEDGLDPRSYHVSALASTAGEALPPASAAGIDLLRTDTLLRLATHLRLGKVAPAQRELKSDLLQPSTGGVVTVPLEELMAADDLSTALASLRPSHHVYSGLREALARHRLIRDQGGWPTLGRGRVLRLGDTDPAVPLLRRRLSLAGDLRPAAETGSPIFDAEVEQALRRFQHRHGLNEDGALGAATRAELDVAVEVRIDQLRVNLERARWIVRDLAESFIAVNVAGQKLHLVRHGNAVWETRVVVGKTATRTPIFSAWMRYLVLNPAWEVPSSIAGEILAEARLDPEYLRSRGFRILDSLGLSARHAGAAARARRVLRRGVVA